MNTILLILFMWVLPTETTHTSIKLESNYLNSVELKENKYQANYDSLINYTKKKEGFRSYFYNDGGYKAIGYGQRQAFYNGVIQEPVTREQAEEMLKISFDNHLKLTKRVYPKLRGNKLLSVAHMSYTIGIGKIIKRKIVRGNSIDTKKLLTIGSKEVRQYEIDLFNS